MRNNSILVYMLNALNVKHTKQYSNKYYNEHPHKNDIYGISKMLTEYGVENQCYHIKDKNMIIKEIEAPFVTMFKNEFIVVYYINNDIINFFSNNKKITLPVCDFIRMWQGIVLLAEADENSSEPDYKTHRRNEILHILKHLLLAIALFLLLFIIGFNTKFHNYTSLIFALLINISGIYISYLLVLKQLHINNDFANKICTMFNNDGDCNIVLESKSSKILGFSWSEIGLGYFISNVFIIIIFPSLYPYAAFINACSLPYTLWSIWYQKFKVNQWCTLCLFIQSILWVLFIYNLLMGLLLLPIYSFQESLLVMCIFLIPILLLNIFISILSEAKKKEEVSQRLNSLKFNDSVLNLLLKDNKKYEVNKSISSVLLGNKESENLITIVSNPHCNPCAQLHMKINNFFKNNQNKYCIQYIFSSFKEEHDETNKFIIAMNQNLNDIEFLLFLNEWYKYGRSKKDIFFKKYKYNCNNMNVQEEYDKHKEWINKTNIFATPTVLYNGHELPLQIYGVEDLFLYDIKIL